MTTVQSTDAGRTSAPWHFWLVTVVSLLWNGFGGYDYTMSHLKGETYYRQMGMTDAQIAFMSSYPAWMHAVWAIGVWGSVVGAILLVLRMRWAFHAFALSALGAIVALVYQGMMVGADKRSELIMPAVIVVICLFFAWYSQAMTKRGVLR
jgi:hypothetical protein